jgi:hypothetical protein
MNFKYCEHVLTNLSCMHTQTNTCLHAHIVYQVFRIWLYKLEMHKYTSKPTHTHTHIHTYTHSLPLFLAIQHSPYIYIYIYIYIYTHTHTQSAAIPRDPAQPTHTHTHTQSASIPGDPAPRQRRRSAQAASPSPRSRSVTSQRGVPPAHGPAAIHTIRAVQPRPPRTARDR